MVVGKILILNIELLYFMYLVQSVTGFSSHGTYVSKAFLLLMDWFLPFHLISTSSSLPITHHSSAQPTILISPLCLPDKQLSECQISLPCANGYIDSFMPTI